MNNNYNGKYLPIGTVVILKGAVKKLMIVGYAQEAQTEDEQGNKKIWDYAAILYPEGYLSSDQFFLFDTNQIDKVFYMGYVDDEQKEFMQNLEKIIVGLPNTNNNSTNNNNDMFDLN